MLYLQCWHSFWHLRLRTIDFSRYFSPMDASVHGFMILCGLPMIARRIGPPLFFRYQRDCWWDPTRPSQSETDQRPRPGLVLLDRRPKQPSHCTGMDNDPFFSVNILLGKSPRNLSALSLAQPPGMWQNLNVHVMTLNIEYTNLLLMTRFLRLPFLLVQLWEQNT